MSGYEISLIVVVVAACLLTAFWLGLCVGSKYVCRKEDAKFLIPWQSLDCVPMADHTGDEITKEAKS